MQRDRAFTLVELMIVVVILGALTAVAIPRIMGGAATAKANACKTNIDLINSQIDLYYHNNGAWPVTLSQVTADNSYFPDGKPRCPVTGANYVNALVDNRVDTADHAH